MRSLSKIQVLPSLRKILGLARALVVVLIAALLVLGLSVRASVARADESMMELGRHLIALTEAGMGRDSRGVLLNGQTIGFRVFTSDQDMKTVLDFYENWCRSGAGDWAAQEEELQGLDQSELAPGVQDDRSWQQLTRRSLADDMGYIACLKHGVAKISTEELGQRLMAFMESGNLRELGQFHYAAVTRIGEQTRVVAVWTEGDFYPAQIFPVTGDAPGFTPENFTPPPSGRRMLSAGELGEDETLAIYIDSEESIDALSSQYRRDFVRRGWRVMSEESGDDLSLFVLQRHNVMRVVSISEQEDGRASVTVATTR